MSDELVIQSESDELLRNRFHIPVGVIFQHFENHLNIENNLRVFFSAKFGSGKTYFLQEFFEANKEKYVVIKLYPVSYSTASNRDIYELIKFDILFHILSEHADIVDSAPKVRKLLKAQFFISEYINQKKASFLKDIFDILTEVTLVDPITKSGTNKIISILFEALRDYEKFKIETSKGEREEGFNFLQLVIDKNSEYSFEDPIGEIISMAIEKLQSDENGKKEVVLLIDDMDRLDPDHLFRILNVFGNHFAKSNVSRFFRNENKFGFNKIITVGDIDNIESIFLHRYGAKADFEGYFSKYFSKDIYGFSKINIVNKDKVSDLVPRLIVVENIAQKGFIESSLNPMIDLIFFHLINLLLKKSVFSLREIYSYIDGKAVFVSNTFEYEEIFPVLSKQYYYLASYFKMLFRNNSTMFKNIYLEEIPICLEDLTKDFKNQVAFVRSALIVEFLRKSKENYDLYQNQKDFSFEATLGYKIDDTPRFTKINTTLKYEADSFTDVNFTVHNDHQVNFGKVNLWDLIFKFF